MKKFVFLTGIFNVLFGIVLQFPFGVALVLPRDSSGMTTHLFGITASFLGILLILSSRDLERFGAIVLLEGMLRIFGFAILTFYALFDSYGMMTLLLGCIDGAIGLAYLILIPKLLDVRLSKILLDAWSSRDVS